MPVKIFVGNLNETSQSSDLQVLFEKYGHVTECDVIKNFGFVHMSDMSEAEQAIQELQGFNFNGYKMNVELSTKGTQGRSRDREGGSDRGGGRGGRGGFRGGRGGRGSEGGRGGRGGRGGGGRGGRYDPYSRSNGDSYRRPPPPDPYDRRPLDPYDRDPYARDPYARDRDPYARDRDPYRDPYARDPYARDPYARDPYARDPYSRDPYARDPYARDPYPPPPRDRERDPYRRPPPEYYDSRRPGADPYERRPLPPTPADDPYDAAYDRGPARRGAGDSELVSYPTPRGHRPAEAEDRARPPQGWDAAGGAGGATGQAPYPPSVRQGGDSFGFNDANGSGAAGFARQVPSRPGPDANQWN